MLHDVIVFGNRVRASVLAAIPRTPVDCVAGVWQLRFQPYGGVHDHIFMQIMQQDKLGSGTPAEDRIGLTKELPNLYVLHQGLGCLAFYRSPVS